MSNAFHTKKLCSRLSSSEVNFSYGKRKKLSSWGPFGGLGATYAVHLRLIGKFVGDFLLVIIELLLLGAFVLSQFTRWTEGQTDRRTDGRTDGQMLIGKTALHTMQRGKNTVVYTHVNMHWESHVHKRKAVSHTLARQRETQNDVSHEARNNTSSWLPSSIQCYRLYSTCII